MAQIYTFVVSEGMVLDAPSRLDLPPAEMNRLRVELALVSGTRRAVLEVAGGRASLTLRPLSSSPLEITVDSAPIRDERTDPRCNGPDVGWQRHALTHVRAHEGVLCDASRAVTQAIFAPLVTICPHTAEVGVSTHPSTTPSIALDSVLDILTTMGVRIRHHPAGFRRSELMSRETWVVDPLYGARLVGEWLEYGTTVRARTLVHRRGVPTHREVNAQRRFRPF